MNRKEIEDIRMRMKIISGTTFRYHKGYVTIKKMAEYLECVHPELYVRLRTTSSYKSRKGRPGTGRRTGYVIDVWWSYRDFKSNNQRGSIIAHDTTKPHRKNSDVASAILRYEEGKYKR